MMGYRIRKLWQESWQNISRHRFLSFASFFIMAITMTFVSVVLLVLVNLQSFSEQVEDSVEIQVFLVSTTKPAELPTIESQLKALENVDSVTFVSRDAALKQLIQEYGSAFELFEGDTNPLYDKFEVQVKNKRHIKQTAQELEGLPSVFQARYGSATAENLLTSLRVVRRFGILLTIVSLLVTMIVLFFTLMMSIKSRQREIQTRMLIGATSGYIRRPFIIQSVLLTVAGGILAMVVSISGYGLFLSRFRQGVQAAGYELCTLLQAGAPVAIIILIVSILFGWFSAAIAVGSSIEYPK
jgi:cell division transport system permease protein